MPTTRKVVVLTFDGGGNAAGLDTVELAADARAARGKIARTKKSVELWHRNRSCSPHYIKRWTELLALPPSQLARRMASLADWEDAMFQNTPWSWAWT